MEYKIRNRIKIPRNKYGYLGGTTNNSSTSSSESSGSSSSSSSSGGVSVDGMLWGNSFTGRETINGTIEQSYTPTEDYTWIKSCYDGTYYHLQAYSTYLDSVFTHYLKFGSALFTYNNSTTTLEVDYMKATKAHIDTITSKNSSKVTIDKAADVTGTLTAYGTLTQIEADEDDENMATMNSVVPLSTEKFNLGSSSYMWKNLYSKVGNIIGLNTENIVNSDTIQTKNLDVKGSAHFNEIIIDKIRATSGQYLLTPIDGFEVFYVVNASNYYSLYWLEEKDGKTTTNDWIAGDYALCKNFFGLKTGKSESVSNQYYWLLVTNSSGSAPETISIGGVSYSCHRINIMKPDTTGLNPHYGDEASMTPKAGDNVIMCGHRQTDSETETEAKQRGSAIYFGTVQGLDYDTTATGKEGLQPPFFAQYEGILHGTLAVADRFNLYYYRQSYFDATGAKFCGNFTVGGKDIQTYIDDKVSTSSFSIAIMNVSTDNNKLTWKAVGYQTVDGERTLMSNDYEIGVILNQDTACEAGYYRESKGVWRQDDGSLVDSKGNAVTKLTFGIYSLDDGTVEGEKPYYTIEYLLSEDSAIMDLVPIIERASCNITKMALNLKYQLVRKTEDSSIPVAMTSSKYMRYKFQLANGNFTDYTSLAWDTDNSIGYTTYTDTNYEAEQSAKTNPVMVIVEYISNGSVLITRAVEIKQSVDAYFSVNSEIGEIKSRVTDAEGNISDIDQKADNINMSVRNGLKETGIDITTQDITLKADKTKVIGNLTINPSSSSTPNDGITVLGTDGLTKVAVKNNTMSAEMETTFNVANSKSTNTHVTFTYDTDRTQLYTPVKAGDSITISNLSIKLRDLITGNEPASKTTSSVQNSWAFYLRLYGVNQSTSSIVQIGQIKLPTTSATFTIDDDFAGGPVYYQLEAAITSGVYEWQSNSNSWSLSGSFTCKKQLTGINAICSDGIIAQADSTHYFKMSDTEGLEVKQDTEGLYCNTSGGGIIAQGYNTTFNCRKVKKITSTSEGVMYIKNNLQYDTFISTHSSEQAISLTNYSKIPVGYAFYVKSISGGIKITGFETMYWNESTRSTAFSIGNYLWHFIHIGDGEWLGFKCRNA